MKKGGLFVTMAVFLLMTAYIGATAAPKEVRAPKWPLDKKCEPYTGSALFTPGVSLIYSQGGYEQIRHNMLEMVDDDTIAIATYLPVVWKNYIKSYDAYIQLVNTDTRVVELRSDNASTSGGFHYPGDVAVGEHTDLWIATSTEAGDFVDIYATSTYVGQESPTKWYVGDYTEHTTFGARVYDKKTGVFLGFNTPTPTSQLSDLWACKN